MAVFKCKMCGGALEVHEGTTVAECSYCGTEQTIPKLLDDKRADLYDRAGHFLRNNEYDKAIGIYEHILDEDKTDAEAYWSIVLCRYGIEYVEDPTTHKRVPTVNRTQKVSVFADEDYKSAIEYADGYQRSIYEAEAKKIDKIQKEILAISEKEEPFDVFICYKESDSTGRRTQDSVLAHQLYYELEKAGFKVFFARITLEKILGSAYEPYIFAALNSAKVMVVLGTKPEYFKAVWVKNEWSRYLSLIKRGENKTLIPAYRDMDPYDLPDEFSHLQAQDMSKLGFMQDLLDGIKKIMGKNKAQQQPVVGGGFAAPFSNLDNLLKRAKMFIEDGDYQGADTCIEKVLDADAENADAYLYKLLMELGLRTESKLGDFGKDFSNSLNYKKAYKFGNEARKTFLKESLDKRKKLLEKQRAEERVCSKISQLKEDIGKLSALESSAKDEIVEKEKKIKYSFQCVKSGRVGMVLHIIGLFLTVLCMILFAIGFSSKDEVLMDIFCSLGCLCLPGLPLLITGFIKMRNAAGMEDDLSILWLLFNAGGFICLVITARMGKKERANRVQLAAEIEKNKKEIIECQEYKLKAEKQIKQYEEKYKALKDGKVDDTVVQAALAATEEKMRFDVTLKRIGEDKIAVIKALMNSTGIGLADAKNRIEQMGVIQKDMNKQEAERLVASLKEVGATVEII